MKLEKTHLLLKPNPERVLLRAMEPASENQKMNIIARIHKLGYEELNNELEKVRSEFGSRHRDTEEFFMRRYNQLSSYISDREELSRERKLLIGSSFSMEYSVESAALFNPSVIWHPDQSGLPAGSKRFILSLRAVGEGHISSIVFRTGTLDSKNIVDVEDPGRFISSPAVQSGRTSDTPGLEYEIYYGEDIPLSERIIFPGSPAESNGVEDARFVEFTEDDGSVSYYATYTAYDGKKIQSQLLETKDLLHFKVNKILGSEAQNKGMALFPRKVNGKYVMLSRQDNENNYIMFSDDLLTWNSKTLLSSPVFPWELVQQGNCGSPVETEEGWLMLTHGVGPVRKYCIGAMLLDRNDPARVIGRLRDPLISADEEEREGYVPNVVYTCGSIVKDGELIIPYAVSDYAGSFAKVSLEALLKELKSE